jgi:hypothetical protein
MDTRPEGVRLEVRYESGLLKVTPWFIPPPRSTAPVDSNDALWPARAKRRAWLELNVLLTASYNSVPGVEVQDEAHEL